MSEEFDESKRSFCKSPFLLAMRIILFCAKSIFVFVGLAVKQQMKSLSSSTAYELLLRKKQEKVMRKMWFTISFYFILSFYLLVYSSFLYSE